MSRSYQYAILSGTYPRAVQAPRAGLKGMEELTINLLDLQDKMWCLESTLSCHISTLKKKTFCLGRDCPGRGKQALDHASLLRLVQRRERKVRQEKLLMVIWLLRFKSWAPIFLSVLFCYCRDVFHYQAGIGHSDQNCRREYRQRDLSHHLPQLTA